MRTLSNASPGQQADVRFFPLDVPTPRHERAILALVAEQPGVRPIFDHGALIGVVATRPKFRSMLADAARRAGRT